MVQPSSVQTNTFKYKNVEGSEITVNIEKHDKCLNIVIKSNQFCNFRNFVFILLLCLLNAGLILIFQQSFVVFAIATAFLVFFVIFQLMSIVQEESLVMINSLGYQLNTKYILGEENQFIPWNQVQNIFLNEVIIRNKIIYSLAFLCHSSNKEVLVPLYVGSRPRLQCLEVIYKHISNVRS